MSNQENDQNIKTYSLLIGMLLLALNVYFYCHPALAARGFALRFLDTFIAKDPALFLNNFSYKGVVLIFIVASTMIKTGKYTDKAWSEILIISVFGLALYFTPFFRHATLLYVFTTVAGTLLTGWGASLASRRIAGMSQPANDINETFKQCDRLVENEYSVNIPTKYKYQGKIHKGFINIVNPFRGVIILGTPGSGKSFAVYNPIIEQTVAKGFTHVVYDYKFPDLTEKIFNEMRFNIVEDSKGNRRYRNRRLADMKVPDFYILNFDDPRISNRCNIFNPDYFKDVADVSEVQEIIWNNVCPGQKATEFFSMSAKEYIGLNIYYLSQYECPEAGIAKGQLCTFPHFIELLAQDFEIVLRMFATVPEIENKAAPFINANDKGAQDQLQGQLASAQIPLNRMASPALYWVLSHNDMNLDVSNPDEPKTLCIGNNPDRESIYGTVLALIIARIFRIVNHGKGKNRPSAILLDEVPTIFLKDVDKVVATARSNKVSVVMGAQDKSQLIRDYEKKNADVIFGTVGNVVSGQVNGQTAQDLSRMFGKEKRIQRSLSQGENNVSTTSSYHDEELLPASRIETLSQGTFFGKIADNFDQQIAEKLFCAQIQIDLKEQAAKRKNSIRIPQITFFGEDEIRENIEGVARENTLYEYAKQELGLDVDYEPADGSEDDVAVRKRMAKYDKAKQQQILDEAFEVICEFQRKKLIQENYDRIKQDIADLIRREKERIAAEDAAAEATDPMDDENEYEE